MTRDDRTTRRAYLKAASAAGLLGLAGCTGTGGGEPRTVIRTVEGEERTVVRTRIVERTPEGAGQPVHMGSILPITGDLSDFGPGMQEGVNFAVREINQAGGLLNGRTLAIHNRDSETDAQKAKQKYNALVNEQSIIGFVGATSSGVSVPLAQGVAADQVMQMSPASTSPVLAELGYNEDKSLKYFGRTAPNDGQQGIVMGRILNEDQYLGADTAAFLHVNNAYGQGLAEKARDSFDGETLRLVPYSSQTTDYTSTLDQLFQGDPDAVGFVGYPESGQSILQTWSDGGYGGNWILSEGLNSPDLFSAIPDILEGMYLSSPQPVESPGADKFTQMFQERVGRAPRVFSPHSYDALMLMALAVEKGGQANGRTIANNIRTVSRPPGEVVTVGEFEKAKEVLDSGGKVNYEGASSDVNLNEQLEPLNRFGILQIRNGQPETLETIPAEFFEGKL